jgi:thymidylate synthase (FAD)
MNIIKPIAVIESYTVNMEENIEAAGRTCWKSDDKIESGSAAPFIERIKSFKHESVLEHGAITVRFFCDRGVSHELVRHRMASFSQESTRYCNYSKGKFGEELTVIDCAEAFGWSKDETKYKLWMQACEYAEKSYFAMLEEGATPQEARSILPNSLKTEVVMTANPREWRHVFRLRCDRAAHPQMREIMLPLFEQFCERWPALFADVRFTA